MPVPVLRIRDVYPGSDFSPSRSTSKNLSTLFNPKTWFLSSRKYDLGCPGPDPDFLPIPDSGSRGQKGTGSRIRIRNTDRYRTLGRYHGCVIANSDDCNKVNKQEPVNNKTFRTILFNSAADLERSDSHQFFCRILIGKQGQLSGPNLIKCIFFAELLQTRLWKRKF